MNPLNRYAQTNVQLFNQLRSEGYSRNERERVFEAYEFAMHLFSGLFLPSGKPFIDHLVGTASILASLHVRIDIVAAGVIHAAYLHGDFGDGRDGITLNRQLAVRNAVGEAVEEYAARYHRLLWSSGRILSVQATLDKLNRMDREVLLMRLANELEHNLDLAALYFAGSEKTQAAYQRHTERYGPVIAEMADRLGFPALALEMQTAFDNTTMARLPIEPCIRTNHNMAYPVIPSSYRERRWIPPVRKLLNAYALASDVMRRAAAACRQHLNSRISAPTEY